MRRTRLALSFATLLCLTAPLFARQAEAPSKPAPPASVPLEPVGGKLPTYEALLKKHTEATGGQAAFDAVKSITIKGRLEAVARNLHGTVVTQMAEPNKRLYSMTEFAAIEAVVLFGFDGTTGWSIDSLSGARLIEGKKLDELRRDSDFRRALGLFEDCTDIKVTQRTKFHGVDAYEVVGKGDGREVTGWFEVDTGYLCGIKFNMETGQGLVPSESFLGDYKSFAGPGGDIKIPMRTEVTANGQQLISVTESVDFGPVDDKVFNLPPAIAALVAQAKAAAEKPDETRRPPKTDPKPPAKADPQNTEPKNTEPKSPDPKGTPTKS
jgi:hypothetical protein